MESHSQGLVSETVKEAASQVLAGLGEGAPGVLADTLPVDQLERILAVSPYFLQTCQRYPEQWRWLVSSGALSGASPVPERSIHMARIVASHCDALGDFGSHTEATGSLFDQQLAQLRKFRHQEMLRIIWRDLTGLASVDETLMALSTMADACIEVAARWAHEAVSERFGDAQDADGRSMRMIVLGMGKLGGQELNVSSDIDLIYIYPYAGQSDGEKRIDNEAYFRRVAQALTQLLGNVTVDGFVFRVDTRLRPFGDSGPLVMNLNALEQYYLTQGRDWERYAMIKARPITGDEDAIAALMELLNPFVYRRYLDYSAIDSLRDLKRKIALSVKQKSLSNNVKLGLGGIREIEFIGQAFQLVRGGRQERLRVRPIKKVLHCLHDMKLMSIEDVQALCEAYNFLRLVENALQAMRDQQVHSLPDDPTDQRRLLLMLGFDQWTEFETILNRHRDAVSTRFNALFSDWNAGEASAHEDLDDTAGIAWAMLSSPEAPPGAAEEAIRSLGLEPTDELMETLASLTRGGFYQRLTSRAQDRVDRILPLLIDSAMKQSNPADALIRCLSLTRAVAGRSGYLQILIERPQALNRLVSLFASSAWVSTFVSRHPIVIDELLRDNGDTPLPNSKQLLDDAMREASRLSDLELDEQMDAMRQFQKARELQVAAAELTDELPLMRASDQLTWLAEAVVAAVVELVEQRMIARHGKPSCLVDGELQYPQFGVVAYGKLGGIELGFGSDLDLVFLHNSEGEQQQTTGPKVIENGLYYARLAQKVVHFMTTHTPAGVLYDIDLRLRPNGQSGVLVIGFKAFNQYQNEQAWTWEHQALVRARMVLGSSDVADRFNQIRQAVLSKKRDRESLVKEVTEMRAKMWENLRTGTEGQMHLKNDPGGVADIEFLVQYLVLAHASDYPEMLEYPDNVRILEVAARSGLIAQAESDWLKQHYLFLRSLIHRQSLQQMPSIVPMNEPLSTIREQITDSWNRLLIQPYTS